MAEGSVGREHKEVQRDTEKMILRPEQALNYVNRGDKNKTVYRMSFIMLAERIVRRPAAMRLS
jgi:hypothetical protein